MPPIPSLRQILYRVFFPDRLIRLRYISFRALLEEDHRCHHLMAHIERIHHERKRVDFSSVQNSCRDLLFAVEAMIKHLNHMAPGRTESLHEVFKTIQSEFRQHTEVRSSGGPPVLILGLEELTPEMEGWVGGKAAHLGVIAGELKLPAPRGAVITAHAFQRFLEWNDLRGPIREILAGIDIHSYNHLEEASEKLTQLILESPLPPDVKTGIEEWTDRLSRAILSSFGSGISTPSVHEHSGGPHSSREEIRWALRSSAVGEDSALSFAGQYRSVLNVSTTSVASAYKEVIASKYAPRALFYRISHGLLDEEASMAVLVMEMIDAEAGGVLYSIDPVASGTDAFMVFSTWGVGEALVSGAASPDLVEVSRTEPRKILRRKQQSVDSKLIASRAGDLTSVPLTLSERSGLSIDDESALRLCGWAMMLETRFGSPQDIEWCRDRQGNLLLLQSRPLEKAAGKAEESGNDECGNDVSIESRPILSGGECAARGAASGIVAAVFSRADLHHIPEGAVLVAPRPTVEWTQVIERISAVVTDHGSAAGHFASIARHWGIPTLVNTRRATSDLKSGDEVTVDATRCRVFSGRVHALIREGCGFETPSGPNPAFERLERIIEHLSPLQLTDPASSEFTASRCKTIHDIVRYVHEKAVQEMFSLAEQHGTGIRAAKKLKSDLPVALYILNLEEPLDSGGSQRKELTIEDVKSRPLLALWEGLTHPSVDWSSRARPMNWGALEQVTTGEGIISLDSGLLASFALISRDYMNVNIRFGFHFVVLDSLCGSNPSENYISFRFEGGGGDLKGRRFRASLLARVLQSSDFEVMTEQDVIVGRVRDRESDGIRERLSLLGRLLAFTPLMDMRMRDENDVEHFAGEFRKLEKDTVTSQ